jgi:hypothetical protein
VGSLPILTFHFRLDGFCPANGQCIVDDMLKAGKIKLEVGSVVSVVQDREMIKVEGIVILELTSILADHIEIGWDLYNWGNLFSVCWRGFVRELRNEVR